MNTKLFRPYFTRLMCKRSGIKYNMTFSHLISKVNNNLSIWAEKAVLKRHSLCLLQQEMRTIICFFLLAFHGSAINRGTFNQIENIVTTFVDWCNTNYHIYTPQKTNIRVTRFIEWWFSRVIIDVNCNMLV